MRSGWVLRRSLARAGLALGLLALLLGGCEKGKPGDACTVTGDGFTRKDSCEEMCLAWQITCPNGATITPQVCSGVVCGVGGSCPAGQQCLQVDSFASNSRCVPTWVCQAAKTSGGTGSGQPGSGAEPAQIDWEQIPPPQGEEPAAPSGPLGPLGPR